MEPKEASIQKLQEIGLSLYIRVWGVGGQEQSVRNCFVKGKERSFLCGVWKMLAVR